ncbi:MAG: GH74, partial [uncultured Frankineae bacterium]
GRRTGAGRDAQGGVRAHERRATQGLAGRRAVLRGLGGLPPEGLTGRPRPHLGEPVRWLVRAGGAALRRRRPHLGPGRQRLHLRRRPRHPPVVRRDAAPVGVRPRVAPRALAHRPRHGVRRGRGRGAVPVHRRRGVLDGALRPAHARLGPALAARRRRDVPAHDPAPPHRRVADLHRHLGGGRLPQRRRRRELGGHQQGPAVRGDPGPRRRGRALRPQPRDAPVEAGHAVHAEALGRHAQRRRRWLVARGQRRPADRLRLPDRRARPRAGHGLRRADHVRLGPRAARRPAAGLPQPHGRRGVGAADPRAAAGALLRQRAARRDGGRPARRLRGLRRDHGRAGLLLARRRRQLGGGRARPAGRAVGGGADAGM